MHEDDIAVVISEATLCEDIDRIGRCVDMLRCVWLALQAERLMTLDAESMVSVRAVLFDAIVTIEEPNVWLAGRAA